MNGDVKNEDLHEKSMSRFPRGRGQGHVWAGLFLLVVGVLLLTRQLAPEAFPVWFFSWPVLLICIGLFIALRHGFRSGGWLVMVLVGLFFLVDRIVPEINMRPFIWPAIIIGLGVFFILGARGRFRRCAHYKYRKGWSESGNRNEIGVANDVESDFADSRDFLDTTSVFGGVKKNVLSKNFRGGDITNFMGGSEIDLTQADFNGRVRIDTTNIFGGTKLIVPHSWDVQSEVVAIFGGVDDKRKLNNIPPDPNKVVLIEGTCLFGGIEIRSY